MLKSRIIGILFFLTLLLSTAVIIIQIKLDPYYNSLALGITNDDRTTGKEHLLDAKMTNDENRVYKIVDHNQPANKTYKIGFVEPVFTYAAYKESSFYTFYHKYKNTKPGINITTDLALLRNNPIPTGPFIIYNAKPGAAPSIPHFEYTSIIKEHVKQIVPGAIFTDLTDIDAHFGRIVESDNHRNTYDILFLFHNEYVTREEYNNLKLFVANGGTIVFTEANALYTEINYDPNRHSITLVKGHNWVFDGNTARKSVSERWPTETSEWTGSNFLYGKPTFVDVDFLNLPFNYTHSEEQHVTNKNAKVLHNYHIHDQKDDNFNATVATYEMHYGKGKVIGLGLYAHTIVGQEGFESFLKLFNYIIIPHSLRTKDYVLIDQKEGEISVPSVMRTGEVSAIEVNNQLHVLTLNLKRSLLQQDNLTISIPRNLIDPLIDVASQYSSESYDIMADGKKLNFDYIVLDSETGFAISLPHNTTTIQIHYSLPTFSANAPPNIGMEAEGQNNTLLQLGQPVIHCSNHNNTLCNGLIIRNNAPKSFPIGSTYVAWTVEDPNSGVSVRDLQKITIYDNIRPDVTITEPPLSSTLANISDRILNVKGMANDKVGIEKVEAFAYELPFDGRFPYKLATPIVEEDWSSWSISLEIGNSTEIGVVVRATDNAGNRNWDKGEYSLNS